jgi:hypothetical protein
MSSSPTPKKNDGGKRPKVKLSKEQKLFVQEFVKLESRIGVCREYIEYWMEFFRLFAECGDEEHEVTPADEKAFFQAMTTLARKHFLFVESMGTTFDGDKDLIKIISAAVSLTNIKGLQENTRDKLMLDWHNQFLNMNKAFGRLLRMLPGNKTLSENLAALKDGTLNASGKKKK